MNPEEPKAKILLVDDTPDNLVALEAVLIELDEELISMTSGAAALRYLLEHEDVAVILLDIQMPEMDGYETARYIRQRDRLKDIPIILLTAIYKSDDSIEQGYAAGAVDYIVKPFNPNILKSKVSVFVELRKRRARQQWLDRENLSITKAKARLVDELADREREVKRVNEYLSLANRELEAFAYSASHDLRAPLRHIKSFIALLKEELLSLSPKQIEYIDFVVEAAKHMDALIEDLLLFSRTGWSQMSITTVDMDRLVQEIVQELKLQFEGRMIDWKLAPLGTAQGDTGLLHIVLMNLIGNAIKYTGKRATAVIEIGTVKEQLDEITYYVRDNGVGFDMKHIDKLFDPFQRLHSSSEFEGTGIGLSLVRRIIVRHNGRTWAEGEVDKGATIYFTLPVEKKQKKSESKIVDRDSLFTLHVPRITTLEH
ncbi:MAG: response regulator [Bacteroidota bacterium]|nr:response regulator [Bacteroidota bacterium]